MRRYDTMGGMGVARPARRVIAAMDPRPEVRLEGRECGPRSPLTGQRVQTRGFTLIELVIVVAMIGVLAALGVYSIRGYIRKSKAGEAKTMLASIAAAQEAYRSETFQYLDTTTASSLDEIYPATSLSALGNLKWAWGLADETNALHVRWRALGVSSTSPVYFGYACIAGVTGSTVPSGIVPSDAGCPDWTWDDGDPTTEPWYVCRAVGNLDGDSDYSYAVVSSFSPEVSSCRDGD